MRAGILLLCLWAPVCAAQTMYKCTDSQRRITYSNEACEKQGLKDAGPVVDRTTSMPFTEPQKPAAGKGPAKAPPLVREPEKLPK
jgi:uncharacterized protein DUF4124